MRKTDPESDASELTPDHRSRRGIRATIRSPRARDAARIWELVERTPNLDANSPYAYLLLCTDFAATGAVAGREGRVVGFVLGYRPPERPEVYFVWQIGVASEERERGVASALIEHVLGELLPVGVTFLEATVTPSNGASWSLFRGLAKRAGADFREAPAFPSDLFPYSTHEDEVRVRIGPLEPQSLRTQRA